MKAISRLSYEQMISRCYVTVLGWQSLEWNRFGSKDRYLEYKINKDNRYFSTKNNSMQCSSVKTRKKKSFTMCLPTFVDYGWCVFVCVFVLLEVRMNKAAKDPQLMREQRLEKEKIFSETDRSD